MRILVGTLYTIENEFDQCVASVQGQTYKAAEHLIIKNLPNKEAHATLFNTFVSRANEFDLLVKVDADMVLARPDLFERVVNKFKTEDRLEHLQIWVHDWITDQLVGGMNIYRNTVRWEMTKEQVFVESSEVNRYNQGAGENDRDKLAPAAIHCGDPSGFQAFHFGLHKGVKVMEALARNLQSRALEHCSNIELAWQHYLRKKDLRLGLAALAGELALRNVFGPADLDYSNPHAANVFKTYEHLDEARLTDLISGLRRGNAGFLPPRLRIIKLGRGWGAVGGRVLVDSALGVTGKMRNLLGRVKRACFGNKLPSGSASVAP